MALMDRYPIISKPLNDYVIVQEGGAAILECKLNDIEIQTDSYNINWLRNGIAIIPSDNLNLYNEEIWQRLEIKCVTKEDEGIYTFVITSSSFKSSTKCLLFVKTDDYDNTTYNLPHLFEETIPYSKIHHCHVVKDDTVTLRTNFGEDLQRCEWYKNDKRIDEIQSQANLVLNKANESDTGLYAAVALTNKQNYLCDYIEVIVGDNAMINTFNSCIPYVTQPTNWLQVYENDDIRLIFKVSLNFNACVEWRKDGAMIQESDRVKFDMYGNRYIALKLYNVTCSDSGEYFLILRNNISPVLMNNMTVTVKQYPLRRPARCTVRKNLTPAVVGIGNGVTFQCSFNTQGIKYIYGLWFLGKYAIERSDARFTVVSSGNEFMLHVIAALPDMSGEVICQLRQNLPESESLLLCNSKAYLTVLPRAAIEREKTVFPFSNQRNIYNEHDVILQLPHIINPFRPQQLRDIILSFKFSKMSNEGIYLAMAEDAPKSDVTDISIHKIYNHKNPTANLWEIEWLRRPQKLCYSIDLFQPKGQYSVIGKTISPRFRILEPPDDTLFDFRIRLSKPVSKSTIHNFCFRPDKFVRRVIAKKMQPESALYRYFTEDVSLGRGTFCSLDLVQRCRDDAFFVTKTKMCALKYELISAKLELKIMRRLKHPNIVTLHSCYYTKCNNGLVLLMDYFWGNELSEIQFNCISIIDEHNIIEFNRQILRAVQYLHSKNIAHLNIQPRNIMLCNRHSRMIKLVDFSSARVVNEPKTVPARYGHFTSPEIIWVLPVGTYSDMWSVGVLTYWMLTSKHPFEGLNGVIQFRDIIRGAYRYDEDDVRSISDRAKVFVSNLIRRYPADRSTVSMALYDPWIIKGPDAGRPKKREIFAYGGMRILDSHQCAKLRWKRTILLILAAKFFRVYRCSSVETTNSSESSSDY